MFAVIKTGGKQYKVANNDKITIAKLNLEPGNSVTFDHVTMFSDGSAVTIGTPVIEGLSVTAEVLEQTRGEKVIAFKKRRRQNSRRKRGHRQDYTIVRITAIGSHIAEPLADEPETVIEAQNEQAIAAEADAAVSEA